MDWQDFTNSKGVPGVRVIIRTELRAVVMPGECGKPSLWAVMDRGSNEPLEQGKAATPEEAKVAAVNSARLIQKNSWLAWPDTDVWQYFPASFKKCKEGISAAVYLSGTQVDWKVRDMEGQRLAKGKAKTKNAAKTAATAALSEALAKATGESDEGGNVLAEDTENPGD